jgi:hypothetical protein
VAVCGRTHLARLGLGVRVLGPWLWASPASHSPSQPAGASACGELVMPEVAARIARVVGRGSY